MLTIIRLASTLMAYNYCGLVQLTETFYHKKELAYEINLRIFSFNFEIKIETQ